MPGEDFDEIFSVFEWVLDGLDLQLGPVSLAAIGFHDFFLLLLNN